MGIINTIITNDKIKIFKLLFFNFIPPKKHNSLKLYYIIGRFSMHYQTILSIFKLQKTPIYLYQRFYKYCFIKTYPYILYFYTILFQKIT
jgi:hypothetical protein